MPDPEFKLESVLDFVRTVRRRFEKNRSRFIFVELDTSLLFAEIAEAEVGWGDRIAATKAFETSRQGQTRVLEMLAKAPLSGSEAKTADSMLRELSDKLRQLQQELGKEEAA